MIARHLTHDIALAAANHIIALLDGHAEKFIIAGSLRRRKPDPDDADIVVLNPGQGYLAKLDNLVKEGVIAKALRGTKQKTFWGAKARALVIDGVKVELYTTDDAGLGYMTWMRTGPGVAGHRVMQLIGIYQAPFTCADGHILYLGQRLHIPTEQAVFTLLGVPYTEPHRRDEHLYGRYIGRRDHRWGDPTQFLPIPAPIEPPAGASAPLQAELFDTASLAVPYANSQYAREPGKAEPAPKKTPVVLKKLYTWEPMFVTKEGLVWVHIGHGRFREFPPTEPRARTYLNSLANETESWRSWQKYLLDHWKSWGRALDEKEQAAKQPKETE